MAIAAMLRGYRPVRLLPLSFLAVIMLGSAVLMLPGMSKDGVIRPLAAAFSATSAVCVTGLTVVDTATYWTPLGRACSWSWPNWAVSASCRWRRC